MNSSKARSSSIWSERKASVVLALFGSVPLFVGKILRRTMYRFLFARMGSAVYIATGVEFTGTDEIELGNRVSIDSGVRLNCWDTNSKLVIRDGVTLDRGIDIKVHDDGYIYIGEATYIGPYACLAGPGHIRIGKNCMIASQTGIYANNHIFADPDRPIGAQGVTREGIVIEDDCWLGCGVKVLDGVTIGRGSVIGAGAVVTKSIPPYSIAVGVPARVVAHRGTPIKATV